ncbi:MAG TPA: TlpA disulfide reductase family protein [Cyclobacteriaceae bacterium]|jgi:peroxiredoxin|nr:TlpA disulfide reductase family protein [Cyclobacteriaceae bacterium]
MRTLLVLIFVSSSICSSAQSKNNFTITGVIDKGYAYKVHLRYTTDSETAIGIDVNETSIVNNGTFSFQGFISQPVQAHLFLDGLSTHAPFYLDTGNITITASVDRESKLTESVNKIEITFVKGSVSDSLQRAYFKKRSELFKAELEDSLIIKNLQAEISAFVNQYPDHNLSSEILRDSYQLSYQQAKSIYDKLSPDQQQKASRNGVSETLERAKQFDKNYPFIALPDTTGKLVSGKSDKTRYLLFDFWVSDCDYCMKQHTELLTVYKQYAKKGFEIVGVSLDDDKQKWISTINHEKFPWPQISDLKGRKNEIAQYFKIPYFPFAILLDSAGKVILINPDKEQLKKRIEKLLSP